jgi:hypothetical protein
VRRVREHLAAARRSGQRGHRSANSLVRNWKTERFSSRSLWKNLENIHFIE